MNFKPAITAFVIGAVGAGIGAFTCHLTTHTHLDLIPNDHKAIIRAAERVGVEVVINHADHCKRKGLNGLYLSHSQGLLVVCQDYGQAGGPEVSWTANDLDTLRHEAHHLIQDCLAYRRGDQTLRPAAENTAALYSFLGDSGFNDAQIEDIIARYRANGADDRTILLELEAFAVARTVDPESIAEGITRSCSL